MLRFFTAGESHGPALTAIVEGFPAGVEVRPEDLDRDLARRQEGYGRGGRMKIERDRVQFRSGIRFGESLGSPITLVVENLDWRNWTRKMSPLAEDRDPKLAVTRPRPGHADLAGVLKYDRRDVRDVLERASARETTMRVAVGGLAKCLLRPLGIEVRAWVSEVGGIRAKHEHLGPDEVFAAAEKSPVRVADAGAEREIVALVDECKKAGDTLGGVVEVVATGLPPGLGSHVHWDRKLDGRLGGALMSLQAAKGVEIGLGFEAARRRGSRVQDEISWDATAHAYRRSSNHAGGTEGGMTNGSPLVVRVAFKPISTLMKPLGSVDIASKEETRAVIERSDVMAIPAAAVIAEAVVAFELAGFAVEKFGGDSLREILRNRDGYLQQVRDA
ncbi:MAG: chorismate synthase [Alphaproteobacteria bacterium]